MRLNMPVGPQRLTEVKTVAGTGRDQVANCESCADTRSGTEEPRLVGKLRGDSLRLARTICMVNHAGRAFVALP